MMSDNEDDDLDADDSVSFNRCDSPVRQISGAHLRKRQHLEKELGNPLLQMSLQDGQPVYRQPDMYKDTDMAGGGWYEISPDRIYVHSLDDSDDEEAKSHEQQHADYEINPGLASQIEANQRRHADGHTAVARWLASKEDRDTGLVGDDSNASQALVLWQPPPHAPTHAAGADTGAMDAAPEPAMELD